MSDGAKVRRRIVVLCLGEKHIVAVAMIWLETTVCVRIAMHCDESFVEIYNCFSHREEGGWRDVEESVTIRAGKALKGMRRFFKVNLR